MKLFNILSQVCMIIAISFANLQAQNLEVTAYGDSREEARQIALSDLASRISVLVIAEQNLIESETDNDYSISFSSNVLTRSELPLLGVEFDFRRTADGIECTASMATQNSARLYASQIKQTKVEINGLLDQSTLDELSLVNLFELQNLIEQLKKLELAATYFNVNEATVIDVSFTSVNAAISQRSNSVGSWSDFLNILQTNLGLSGKTVFVYPPRFESNREVTAFAKVIRDRLGGIYSSTASQSLADISIRGTYREVGEQLELTIRATDKNYTSVGSVSIKLNKVLFEPYDWKPRTTSFDDLVNDGVVVSSDLSVNLATNKGRSDLLFLEGETIELLVKSNQSGYIYFVGYSSLNESEFSYLLPVGNGDSKRDMILYVNADDVNKWVSLGEFEVAAPFGLERLQAYASTEDLIDALPEFYWNESGYPEIGKDPTSALVQTRGLLRKKSEEAETAESFLFFTTMEN